MTDITERLEERERELYETHLRRLNYDDRDSVFYQNMLDFLWKYVIGRKSFPDMEDIYEEYSHWNMQMIEKVLYHEHDIPYANIRRCYQSILELLRENPGEGLKQIQAIGQESFSYDGKAPKTRMDARGRIFRPMSKLFVLYNYAKYYEKHGMAAELQQLKKDYIHAFTTYGDEEHRSHDQYLTEQMEILKDKIIYPVEEKVYKIPWGPKDFYLYYNEDSFVNL